MTQLLHEPNDASALIADWRNAKLKSCVVPTMGSIHDGHLALIARAREMADRVIVSIYVNPTQFAVGDDFERYPRGIDADMARIGGLADAVYAPDNLYHPAHATQIIPAGAAIGLESEFRPQFFAGVATIVLKLFNQMPTDFAVFGEKDFQQLAVIRQLVRDLDVPIEILDHPTVREADGLALSSRNLYLDAAHRAIAPTLHKTLSITAKRICDGEPVTMMLAEAQTQLLRAGFSNVDYLRLLNPDTLQPTEDISPDSRLLVAAHLANVRLIDNIALGQN